MSSVAGKHKNIKRLSQLKRRMEEAIDGGSTEIPKWLEQSEEIQTLLPERCGG